MAAKRAILNAAADDLILAVSRSIHLTLAQEEAFIVTMVHDITGKLMSNFMAKVNEAFHVGNINGATRTAALVNLSSREHRRIALAIHQALGWLANMQINEYRYDFKWASGIASGFFNSTPPWDLEQVMSILDMIEDKVNAGKCSFQTLVRRRTSC